MKLNVLTVALLATIMSVNAQTAYVGRNVNSLLGAKVKVIEKSEALQQYGYDVFFNDSTLSYSSQYGADRKKGVYNTPYELMVGREFDVIKIGKNDILSTVLVLQNSELGIVYYKYSAYYEHTCVLDLVSIPEDFYCSQITKEIDKFENKTTYRTDLMEDISFTKVEDGNNTRIYMSLETRGSTLNVGVSGVKILLDNGDVLNFNTDIDVKSGKGSGWVYRAFIPLDNETIDILTQHSITDFRLYIYDRNVKNGEKFKQLLICLDN